MTDDERGSSIPETASINGCFGGVAAFLLTPLFRFENAVQLRDFSVMAKL